MMKHPILYRVVFYGIMIGLCVTVSVLLSIMNEAPFSSRDMRKAYFDGCNIGGSLPLSDEHVDRCSKIADTYKETLDDLDKQMEKYIDGSR